MRWRGLLRERLAGGAKRGDIDRRGSDRDRLRPIHEARYGGEAQQNADKRDRARLFLGHSATVTSRVAGLAELITKFATSRTKFAKLDMLDDDVDNGATQ